MSSACAGLLPREASQQVAERAALAEVVRGVERVGRLRGVAAGDGVCQLAGRLVDAVTE